MTDSLTPTASAGDAPPVELRLPVLNANDDTALVLKWHAEEGARVEAGAPLLSVETTKATVELESPAGGFVRQFVREGSTVERAGLLASIYPTEEGYAAARGQEATAAVPGDPLESGRGLARPATKQAQSLAASSGVDLSSLPGEGLITHRHVEDWLARRRDAAQEPAREELPHSDRGERPHAAVPLHPQQRRMANVLSEGWKASVPGFVSRPVAAAPVVEWCQAYGRKHRCPLSETDVFLKVCAAALRRFDYLNAWHDAGTIRLYQQVEINVAFDVEGQLVTPVLADADRLSLKEIARWRVETQLRAQRGDEGLSAGGTFSLSNLAREGIEFFIPNLAARQSATLGIGRRGGAGATQEWVLCLSFNHATVNGSYAARFLNSVSEMLAQVETLA